MEELAATGIKPPALDRRPSLKLHQGWYADIFWMLSRSRLRDMGSPQYLQLSEIVCYLDEYRVWSEDLRDRVIQHMQSMDLAYMESIQKQQEVKKTKH